MTHKSILVTLVFAALAAAPAGALAQIGDTDVRDKELVASSIWILGHQDQGDFSNTAFTIIGEGAFRYFVADNLGVGVSGGAFFKSAGDDAEDSGFTFQAVTSYYLSLSDQLYLAPGIGLGATFGSRQTPIGTNMLIESDILGFTTSVGMPFVLFTPGPFSVRAGPELIATFGSAEDTATGDSESFTTIDGGFKIGVGFNF